MVEKQLKVKIKHRVDSSANWTKNNPILLAGEIGIISDTNEFRIGDGTTRFNSLKSIFIDKTSIETLINSAVSSGIASGADKLTTARTISLSGDVTGSVSFDGSKDVSITSTVADNSHNHTISNVTNLQTELNKKANLDSPALTGVPTAPTATTSTNNTQIATTEYVNKAINSKLASSDALIYKGTIGTGGTVTVLPDEHTAGWTYRVITAGTYAGQNCEVGDLITCLTSGTTSNDSHWTVVQTNIDGAVTGPTSSVTNHVVTFNGTSGRVIKDSGFTISSSVPVNAKFTDTTYTAGSGLSLSGTEFSNTGVHSLVAGTTPDKLSINTNGATSTITINQVANAKNADLATKASQDSTGQQIDTTYVKELSVNGKVITFTKGDGSTSTITTQDTNTTYSAGTGLELSGTTFSNSGVRSITAGTTSDKLSVDTGGTTSTLTINNVANAVSATKATQDGDGNVISSTYAKLSGAEFTGNVVFDKIHRDTRYASNVCRFFTSTTPTEFVLKTKIAFKSASYMPLIRLYGYAYGLSSPIELRVGFYIYDNRLGWSGVSCTGAWKPEVYLFTYTENETKYVAVGFKGSCYYPGFQVDAQIPTMGQFNSDFNLEGWSVLENGSDTSKTIIPAVGTNDCVSVEYKTMKTDIEGSATKLSTARTISLTGDVTGSTSFDGSNNVSITATVADNSHNHTISNVTGLQSALDGKASTSTATTSASGLMSADDKKKLDGIAENANNYLLPTASTSTLGGVKVDGSTITISNGVISSPNQTTITGNAGTATQLKTARTISLSGDVTGSVSFDGSKDVTITSTIADDSHNHSISTVTGLQTVLDGKASTDVVTTSTNGLMSSTDKTKLDGIESGANKYTLPIASTTVLGGVKVDGSTIKITDGVISSPNQTSVSGNAGTATKLETARTITLSGGATGSTSFDGSANATINVTVTNNSHSHTIANVTNLQSELNNKAPLASPALTGTPTAPTASIGTSNTQIATTEFVSAAINNKLADAAELMKFKGTLGADGTVAELPATHNVGWSYKVATAGTYAGNACEIGDLIICIENGTTSNDSHWTVVQTNIDGAVTGPTSSVTNHVVTFNGTSGKVIKDSGFTIATSVPANAKFTDTVYTHPTSGVTAGTYRSVTVDVNGHVTAGTNPTTLSEYGITDAAPKNSPALTGAPTAPTADAGTNTTQIATTAFVNTAISNKTTITGNAGSATKLQTARTISLSGDVTGSVSFDGTKNVDITTSVTDDSHNHSISTVTGLQNALDGKASTDVVTTTTAGLMSAEDKTKLDGIATGANKYTLPTASTSTLGGVKVDGSTITISNGVISSPAQTSVSGNAGSADKVNNKLTLKVKTGSTEDTDLYTFDGSSAKTLDIKQGTNVTLTAASGSLTIAAKDTTYSAGDGLSLSGTAFSNSGVRSITAGSSANQLSVNTGGTTTTITVNNVASATAADKLSTARKIDGVSFNGSADIIHYGTCSTEAATAAKVVSITGFTLVTGAEATIKFTVTNTAASPTLNINSTGAKAIQYRDSAISAGYLAANRTYRFVYDGTNYQLIGDINTDTTVTQKVTTTNAEYSMLAMADAAATATKTNTSRFSTGITMNPSTNTITATTFNGQATNLTDAKLAEIICLSF